MCSQYILFLLFFSAINLYAESPEAPQNSRIRIFVTVVCPEEPVKAEVKSYYTRELRKLGDIDVTDEDYNAELDCIVLPVTLVKGGKFLGYTLSVTVETKRKSIEAQDAVDLSKMDENDRLAFIRYVIPIMTLEYFSAYLATKDDLEEHVAQNVAEIDGHDYFKRLRKTLLQHVAKASTQPGP